MNVRDTAIVLVRTRNPLNIGAVARAMGNFGFTELRLVEPFAPSLLEARSAVDASAVLRSARIFSSVTDAVTDCALVLGTSAVGPRQLTQPVLAPPAAAARVHAQCSAGQRIALLFGSEKTGLSREELSSCHAVLSIPMHAPGPKHVSMNLGQAAAVCLYELTRPNTQPAPPGGEPISAVSVPSAASGDMERLAALLLELSLASGSITAHQQGSEARRMRELVRRLAFSRRDAVAAMRLLRRVLWRLRHP